MRRTHYFLSFFRSLVLFCLFFTSFQTFSYIPTLESIFRNPMNGDLSFRYLKVKMDFHTLTPLMVEDKTQEQKKYTASYYLHYLFTPQGLVTIAMGKDGFQKKLPSAWSAPSLNVEIEQRIFFSALESIFLSKSYNMGEVLKVFFPGFKKNADLVNNKKLYFLQKHKKIMAEFHEYHQAKRPIPGALNAQLQEIHRSKSANQENFYLPGQLEYTYQPGLGGIFLKSNVENIEFLFDHQTHRLLQVELPNGQPKIKFVLSAQTFINEQGAIFPKEIDIYEENVPKWRIEIPRVWMSAQIPPNVENLPPSSGQLSSSELYPPLVIKLP